MNVIHECVSCNGTGLYCGFAEAKGTAVICLGCKGQGWQESTFRKFDGRKRKNGVKAISKSRGSFIATGVGAVGDSMTYAEFEAAHPVKVPA
jgi:hypothetical protein